jgi:tetratricopeptide (TPR) repeat protein
VLSVTGPVFAQEAEDGDAPLGHLHFAVSCTAEAQQEFDHAVLLLHHMTYPQAKAGFERVAERDPECAMAYWGVAMTLFQPLWPTRPGPRELQQGRDAVRRANALAPPTERERLYIAAADSFFLDPRGEDYWERIRRWAQASEILYQAFPDDAEARAFYALALLATAPVGGSSHEQQDRAAELLLSIQEENPTHPGSMHYLVHANDVRGREHESLDVVRHYGEIAPRNPHALHMPTHIYTRLGEWNNVIEGNLNAADAALEHPAGDEGQYVWDEFPHAIEYLVYAYLQQGADSMAALQIERLQSTERLQPAFKTAFHLASIPARYALERQAWEEAANLNPRPGDSLDWDRFPWPEAVTWFARGLGAVHGGRLDDSQRAHDRLLELEGAAHEAGEELFTRQIRILRLGVSAWIAHAQGEDAQAVEQMGAAADLEGSTPKHPVTPAPTLPAYELLGHLLLEKGQHAEALAAFERSLELHPRRFNSLLGAARAARALGEEQKARSFYTALLELSVGESTRSGLSEARAYLGKDPNQRE